MLYALQLATAKLAVRALRLLSLPVVLSGDGDGKLRLHWLPR